MKPVSYYVTVTDVKESIAFYSKLFTRDPVHVEERYSRFQIGEFSFGLFNRAFDTQEIKVGNNTALCFMVEDIEKEYNRLKLIASFIDPGIMDLPNVRLFQFKDLDDNLLEVFQEK